MVTHGCGCTAAPVQLRCAKRAAVGGHGQRQAAVCLRAQGALAVADGKADGVPLTNGKKAHSAASAAAPAASAGAEPAAPASAEPAPTAATAAVPTAAAPAPMPAYKVMPAEPAPDTGAAGAAPSPFAAAPPLAEEEDDREPLQRTRPQKAKREYQGAPLPANEGERHAQLCKLGVLDSEPDPRFDDITKLVRGRVSLCRRAREQQKQDFKPPQKGFLESSAEPSRSGPVCFARGTVSLAFCYPRRALQHCGPSTVEPGADARVRGRVRSCAASSMCPSRSCRWWTRSGSGSRASRGCR